MRPRVAALAALALALACLRGDRPRVPPTLTVAPEVAFLFAGGPGVELRAFTTGEVATIRWGVAGPGWLTAREGETTAYVPPDRLDADAEVVVTARARGASAGTCRILVQASPAFAGRVEPRRGSPRPGRPVSAAAAACPRRPARDRRRPPGGARSGPRAAR